MLPCVQEAAALNRQPMPFSESSTALEQRYSIHKRPAPSTLGQPPPKRPHQPLQAQAPPLPQAPGMPPVPSPAPFSAGKHLCSHLAACCHLAPFCLALY